MEIRRCDKSFDSPPKSRLTYFQSMAFEFSNFDAKIVMISYSKKPWNLYMLLLDNILKLKSVILDSPF